MLERNLSVASVGRFVKASFLTSPVHRGSAAEAMFHASGIVGGYPWPLAIT